MKSGERMKGMDQRGGGAGVDGACAECGIGSPPSEETRPQSDQPRGGSGSQPALPFGDSCAFFKKNCVGITCSVPTDCTQDPASSAKCVDGKCQKMYCSEEGDTIPTNHFICCDGLKAVGGWPGGYKGNCSVPPPPTGLSICTKCGDGKCNPKTGENKCNCPVDCK